jgi:hypothetical protein
MHASLILHTMERNTTVAAIAEQLYRQRLQRYVTAMSNEKADRVPIRVFSEEFSAKYCGYDNYAPAVDLDLQFDVNRRFAVETGIDAVPVNSIVNWFGMQKALGWKGITFPGIGLPVDSINQWTEPGTEEGAFLRADEYDEFIDDPTAFLVNAWLPRFTAHVQPLGGPVSFEHNMSLINGVLAYSKFFQTWGAKQNELIQAGVVPAVGSVLKAPLDILGDKLRGYLNLSYDLHDHRDKVVRACEALMPHLTRVVLGAADPQGRIPSIIWMHRGSVPFISREDFREIYWPTLKPIVEELWRHGHQIVFYGEGDWTAHLGSFAELPDRSMIFHVDKTDILEAKRVLGGRFCLSGGIDNEILALGSRHDVEDRCRFVIDAVARDGGYIMDAGALLLSDAKIENVEAMIEFTLDYGTYSRSGGGPGRPAGKGRSEVPAARPPGQTGGEGPGGGGISSGTQRRPPGVCIPWEEKKKDLPPFEANEELARKTWEEVDALGYSFCWTNLTW